jgi:acyl-CoA thioesterase
MGDSAMKSEAESLKLAGAAGADSPAAAAAAVRENALHQCIIAYASDSPLLFTCLQPHGRSVMQMGMMASLDHSMWWHAPARADEWILFRVTSPRLVSGRGLCMGHMWRPDGTLIATVAQEGVVRTPLYEEVQETSDGSRGSKL